MHFPFAHIKLSEGHLQFISSEPSEQSSSPSQWYCLLERGGSLLLIFVGNFKSSIKFLTSHDLCINCSTDTHITKNHTELLRTVKYDKFVFILNKDPELRASSFIRKANDHQHSTSINLEF